MLTDKFKIKNDKNINNLQKVDSLQKFVNDISILTMPIKEKIQLHIEFCI